MTMAESLPAQNAGERSFGRAAEGDIQRLSFTGSGSEYFGIWIVNILLTIITLGIYSAWAKVRRNRYFYGNTILLGRGFEYHASGGQILIGRLIVFAYLVLYNIMLTFVPLVGIGLGVLMLFFVPWLVARGLRFSARVTSYRNVRFDFVGGAGGAFLAFIIGPVLAALTLGILAPLASRWSYRYVGNNLRYGQKPFSTDPPLGRLYRTWVAPAAVLVLGMLIGGFFVFLGVALVNAVAEGAELSSQALQGFTGLLLVLGYLLLFAIFGLAALIYRAGVRNVAWSATSFDGRHRLLSEIGRAHV